MQSGAPANAGAMPDFIPIVSESRAASRGGFASSSDDQFFRASGLGRDAGRLNPTPFRVRESFPTLMDEQCIGWVWVGMACGCGTV